MLHAVHEFFLKRVPIDSVSAEGGVVLGAPVLVPVRGSLAALSAREIAHAQSFAAGVTAVARIPLDVEVLGSDLLVVETDDWFGGEWAIGAVDHTPKHLRAFLRRIVRD